MKPLRWGLFSFLKNRMIRRCAVGASLALGPLMNSASVSAQDPGPIPAGPSDLSQSVPPVSSLQSSLVQPSSPPYGFDPVAPTWCAPVYRVPNFFGGFFGVGVAATGGTPQTLTYTGSGAEGGGFNALTAPITVNGPGGPFILNNDLPTPWGSSPFDPFAMPEDAELTALIQAQFPGATYSNGSAIYTDTSNADFVYNYLASTGLTANVNLPNPTGGGLVGRNRYFENGSPIPRDRSFFTYDHIGGYRGLNNPFNINRYVFGQEKTFFGGMSSFEVRLPFAGTASSDQIGNSTTVMATEFGNVGMLLKSILYSTPNFVASVGLGTSAPTANNSRLLVGGTPFLVEQNRAWLLQPIAGVVWAPNDRFYAQLGLQFDLDPFGNPVQVANGVGGMNQIGRLNDQKYSYFDTSVGYWLYENRGSETLTGIALQSELHYYQSFGGVDRVSNGVVSLSDARSNLSIVNGTTGAIFRIAERAVLSFGISYPLSGDRLYDWSLQTQFNYYYGRPRM